MPRTWTLTVSMDDEPGEDWSDVGERMENIWRELRDWISNAGTVRMSCHSDAEPTERVGCGRCGHSESHDLAGSIGFCRSYGCLCNRRDIEASVDAMQRPAVAEVNPDLERILAEEERRQRSLREAREAASRLQRERENRLVRLAEPEEEVCEECRHYPHSSGACSIFACACQYDATQTATPSAPVQSAEDIEAWIASL